MSDFMQCLRIGVHSECTDKFNDINTGIQQQQQQKVMCKLKHFVQKLYLGHV